MTTFAPHRDTLESFVDCINGGADKDILTGLLAEEVVLYGPFGDEPVTGREAAVETIKTVNGLSSDDTYMEVLSGETHHAAHFRLQVGDAAVNGIFFVLLDADGKIAEAVGSRLGLPVVSIPADELMLPGYFGMFTNLVTMDLPATSIITRQTLGWEPTQPKLFADLDNGHYFSAS